MYVSYAICAYTYVFNYLAIKQIKFVFLCSNLKRKDKKKTWKKRLKVKKKKWKDTIWILISDIMIKIKYVDTLFLYLLTFIYYNYIMC